MATDDKAPAWLARLLTDHAAALVLYARQWCHSPEDVVQEALVELVSQRRPPDNPVAWLYRVVRNGAISAARRQGRREKREQRVAAPEAWFAPVSGPLDAQEAAASLASLELELREVVVARIWGNLTFAEIANLVGTSLSTAQRLHSGNRTTASKIGRAMQDERPRHDPALGGIEARLSALNPAARFDRDQLMFAAGQRRDGAATCAPPIACWQPQAFCTVDWSAALFVAPRGPSGAVSPIAGDATSLAAARRPSAAPRRPRPPRRFHPSDDRRADQCSPAAVAERGDRESFEPRSGHEALESVGDKHEPSDSRALLNRYLETRPGEL